MNEEMKKLEAIIEKSQVDKAVKEMTLTAIKRAYELGLVEGMVRAGEAQNRMLDVLLQSKVIR